MMKCHVHFVDDEIVIFCFGNISLRKRIASLEAFGNSAGDEILKRVISS